MQKIIVVSAVNLVEGGTLTILSQCLSYLNDLLRHNSSYKVIALVHDKNLCFQQHSDIEYVEFKDVKGSWWKRCKFEYWDCFWLSKKWKPYLWFSLHDMTPNVQAERRAVYCHNPTPFRQVQFRDLLFNYKLFLFTCFYRFLYRINISKNDFVVVQQDWLRSTFVNFFHLRQEKVIVSYPKETNTQKAIPLKSSDGNICFFYPSLPRPFKNFEVICQAVEILNQRAVRGFTVYMTLDGSENKYARWIYKKYQGVANLVFTGLLSFVEVQEKYAKTDCLIFPSTLETWGLPVSEFSVYNKPILIADLPYAHETASGSAMVCFFKPSDANELANRMEMVIMKKYGHFVPCNEKYIDAPFTHSWKEIFDLLLK